MNISPKITNIRNGLLMFFVIVLPNFCIGQIPIPSLIDSLNNYLEDKHIPGAMITIVKADTVLYSGGIGFADLGKKEPVTDLHLFRQGSISKSFTALGLIKLLSDKNMTLNTPIREIDAEIPFSNDWAKESPVTIENLLEHTSGFDDFHLHAIYNKTDSVAPPTASMVFSHRKSLNSRWKPGTKKAYSNSGYIVAGHVLETLAGKSYDQYLKESVLVPLGMESSGYFFKEPQLLLMSQGYRYRGGKHVPVSFTSIQGGPAGELCANARDMSLYLQFMLNRGITGMDSAIFTRDVFDRIENAKTNLSAKKGLPGGYGLGNYSIWKKGHLFHGHGGGIDGFASRYVYSREADIGVAVAINRESNATAIVDEILTHLLGKRNAPPQDRIIYPIPNELKEKYEGFYCFNSPRQELVAFTDRMLAGLVFEIETDKILTRSILGKLRDTLYYAGENQFFRNDEGVPSVMLLEAEDGNPACWVNENYTEMESRAFRLAQNFAVWISLLLPFIFAVYGLIWLCIQLFSKNSKPILNHLILFSACLSYLLMIGAFALAMEDLETAGNQSFPSILLYLSSLALPLLSVISIFRWFRLPTKKKSSFFYILTSISMIILSVFFWSNGFIGLKLWAY